MTVTYSLEVSCSRLCTFLKLLFRWRGSLYKLLWREMLLFLIAYYSINLIYRFLLDQSQKILFENISSYCDRYTEYMPLTFVLGFYLNIVYERWWQQWQTVQWPDRMALYLTTFLHGNDVRGRLLRRSIIRYLNLSSVLGLRMISSAVLKRFPTMDHLVEAGFLTESELKTYESIQTPHSRQWIPCVWASSLLYTAKQESRIDNDRVLLELIKEVNDFLQQIRQMTHFDWISVPLVYTQVVTLAVYSFFLACVMGRQFLDHENSQHRNFDVYFPFFTFLQLCFYVGWLKVAEVAINPFGEDEDDFEVNFILERNLQISYAFVDDCYRSSPNLEPDIHWNKTEVSVPHTAASFGLNAAGFCGSTVDIKITAPESEIVVQPPTRYNSEQFLVEGNNEKDFEANLLTSEYERNRLSLPQQQGDVVRKRSFAQRLVSHLSNQSPALFITRPVVEVSRRNSNASNGSVFTSMETPMFMSQKRVVKQFCASGSALSLRNLSPPRTCSPPPPPNLLLSADCAAAVDDRTIFTSAEREKLQSELIKLTDYQNGRKSSVEQSLPIVSHHLDTITEDPKSQYSTINRTEVDHRLPVHQIAFAQRSSSPQSDQGIEAAQ